MGPRADRCRVAGRRRRDGRDLEREGRRLTLAVAQPPEDLERLVPHRDGPFRLTVEPRHGGQLDESPGQPAVTTDGPVDLQALLELSASEGQIPICDGEAGEVAEGGTVAPHVAAPAERGGTLLEEDPSAGGIALGDGQIAQVCLCQPGAARVADPASDGEALLEVFARFGELTRRRGEVAEPSEPVRDGPLVADHPEQVERVDHVAAGGVELADGAPDHAPICQRVAERDGAGDILERHERLLEHQPVGADRRFGDEDLADPEDGRRKLAAVCQIAEQAQAVIDQSAGIPRIAGIPANDGQPMERRGLTGPEPGLPRELEALAIVALGDREVVLRPRRGGHHLQRSARLAEVAVPSMDHDGLVRPAGAERGVPGPDGEGREPDQRPRAGRGLRRRSLQDTAQPPTALDQVAVPQPERPEEAGQIERPVTIRRQAPIQRGPQVVVLDLEPIERHPPGRSRQGAMSCFGDGQSPGAVGRLDRGPLAMLDEPVEAVLADGLQHPVARHRGRVIQGDERLVHELTEERDRVARAAPGRHGDRLDGIERRAADEHRQQSEHPALRLGQQVVAPVERGLERLLAGQRRPAAADQEVEAIVQTIGDRGDGEDGDARRGELDGQGQTVEVMAQARDGRRVLEGEHEGRIDRLGALDEEPDRVDRHELRRVDLGIRVRDRQRRHAEDDLARDPEGLTAGGQDPHAGAAPEERLRDRRARVDQVLAVVEDEQDLAIAQMLDDELDVRLGLPFADAEDVGHGLDDQGGVADRRELDQPYAVAVRADLR